MHFQQQPWNRYQILINDEKYFDVSNNIYSYEVTHEVKTSSGVSSGVDKNGVISWNDIPYAQPPIGNLRWKAPRPIVKNDSFILNTNKVNFCIQQPSGLGGADGESMIVGSENCLYLDIKAPKNANKLLPVMFWIHGGGNTTGRKDIYDFSKMVKNHDVIVVTINYRLGPLGWFTLDIIQALRWVNKNIEKFGGNKNNITVFGESAGGHNVLSLLVSPLAKGLFHKAISQSGYTTSINLEDAYKQYTRSDTSQNTSSEFVKKIRSKNLFDESKDLRQNLLDLDVEEIYAEYLDDDNQNIPLLTNDGIVIPKIGLKESLSKKEFVNQVPLIAGSNRDEVKLWLGSATYFVTLEYSFFGNIFNIPRVRLKDKDAFEAFNYYRSNAWQIRGVDEPLEALKKAGLNDLYAYRYDWDDHRKYFIANFKDIIGAAHATEIPLLTGNNKLVGDYGFFIYPKGPSKKFTSKNMMKFWTNFAKTGSPGISTNGIKWDPYFNGDIKSFMILDNKNNLMMKSQVPNYADLVAQLSEDINLNAIEKCVILFQMGTYVGLDIYQSLEDIYPQKCDVLESI
ncbi:MAG: carboxylesterase family protein, partial [Candidatus Neomarinimicrobiota bacterium]